MTTNKKNTDQTGTNRRVTDNIIAKVSGIRKQGRLKEAAGILEKIMLSEPSKYNVVFDDIFTEWLEDAARLYPPPSIVERTDVFLKRQRLEDSQKADIRFLMGKKMEVHNEKQLATILYQEALDLGGDGQVIRDRLSRLTTDAIGMTDVPAVSRHAYLIQNKLLTQEDLAAAKAVAEKSNKSIELVLMEKLKIAKETIGKSLSLFYGCPFRSFDPDVPVPKELIKSLKKTFLVNYMWLPLRWDKGVVEVLIDDPLDLRKTDYVSALISMRKVRFSVGIREDILRFIDHFFKPRETAVKLDSFDELNGILKDVAQEEDLPEEEEEDLEVINESSSQVVRLVDQILLTAFRKEVSDIHIEPSPVAKMVMIRFRLDGVCQEYAKIPIVMARAVISRLKIMASLDIAERRLPQDGKIKMKRRGVPSFELRISTMPTTGGHEDAVLRILAKAGAMKLDDMGLSKRNLRVMKNIISQPYGLILVVGPTGSGKTTTLHSALGHINNPKLKIWTAEDPVEITQQGLRQVEAKPRIGLDFARIMRGFLRLDPDVIMIGEMRDEETASIGVEASLTGHLVFSTLHTNSAPETVTRLLDMGLNPLNFSDALLGVLAQRLVRRLCKTCRAEYRPPKEVLDEITKDYGTELMANSGFASDPEMVLYRPEGCDACSAAGYKGRMGIHELMEGTNAIKSLIKGRASTDKLFAQALSDGMRTLKQDGIEKAFQGFTDHSEIRRVCVE